MTGRGTFVISIDVEGAWGTCDRPLTARWRRALLREREVVQRLLALFAAHDVRASWALVGHLLLDSCPRQGDLFHPEIPRPMRLGERRDWFAQHPLAAADPLWFGRDLAECIRTAVPPQEIGSHSFSHILYAEGRTSVAAVRADLEMARRCHLAAGLPFTTFVFPRNVVGFRDLLAAAGIRVYRGRTSRLPRLLRARAVRHFLTFAYFLVPVPAAPVEATLDENGLVNVPGAMALYRRSGLRALVAPRVLAAKAIGGLERAAGRGRIFHLWFHPSDLTVRTEAQFVVLESILAHADRLRAAGRLEIKTLGEVQAAVCAGERPAALAS